MFIINSTASKVNKTPNSVSVEASAIPNNFTENYVLSKLLAFCLRKKNSSFRIKYVFKNKTMHFGLVHNVLKFHELHKKSFVFCCTSMKWGIDFITLVLQPSALIFCYARQRFFVNGRSQNFITL